MHFDLDASMAEGAPFGGGRDDVLGEELHLAHLSARGIAPWSKNEANHFELALADL
jgi:hypothetical protein